METLSVAVAIVVFGERFPDYFKSELMETTLPTLPNFNPSSFPDYFKSELMETI